MTKKTPGAREKILESAAQIVRESGAGNMSLDAVAARAGVSKGGLLYHFSSKAKLFETLVEQFVSQEYEEFQKRRRSYEDSGVGNGVTRAYIDVFVEERARCEPPPSGLLAALAENPDFLRPVQRYEREVLDQMKADASDPALAVIALLVVHGVRAMELLSIDVVEDAELSAVIAALRRLLDDGSRKAA
ncbi:TetR/AcrR family transcriptional regulator [Nitratireductor sp. ZSWI3]|uniref:TetR/AcrR family transcriptional regulator n=1 Tax=Nitratireductor sp. ZSWI3 TaxID=2966359 RepID=UPI0021504B2A|nr:TetR/AcrR family transcriptional regulator [Nitratireductor sp. ZSWI3]MCR4267674.1 TetR/AcrR family transcriptional regulator [Nitratireductor sp. ZSWI3]